MDRLNDIVGLSNWFCTETVVSKTETESSKGKTIYNITIKTTVTILDDNREAIIIRECFGGHSAPIEYDAFKGAFTNAFKKTVALLGLGASAYRGSIDDDILPDEESQHKVLIGKSARENKMKEAGTDIENLLKENGLDYGLSSVNGKNFIVVSKNSYEKRTLLKTIGFKFNQTDKKWYKQVA